MDLLVGIVVLVWPILFGIGLMYLTAIRRPVKRSLIAGYTVVALSICFSVLWINFFYKPYGECMQIIAQTGCSFLSSEVIEWVTVWNFSANNFVGFSALSIWLLYRAKIEGR